jgi:hypothetical protein
MEIPLLKSLPVHYQYPHLESFSSSRNLAPFTEVQMLDNRTRPQQVQSLVEHMSVTIQDSPPLVVRSNHIFEIARESSK